MNILVLSRQLPSLAPYHAWFAETISTCRLFTDVSRLDGYTGFQDVRGFEDYETSSLVELEVLRLHRTWPIARIVATSEADILRAARLRTHLGLPGQQAESAFAFRDKVAMKRALLTAAPASFRVPRHREVNEAYDVLAFIEQHGYPVIVKPVDGFNAMGTHVLRSDADLEALLRRGVSRGLEVEEFVAGDFYHVDGFVLDGEVVLVWPSKYVREYFTLSAVQSWIERGCFTGSYMLSPQHRLTPRLRAMAREVLRLLPTPPSTSFHLEVFHTPSDDLVFCEIASRTGGAMVNPAFEHGFGFNLARGFVRAQAGLPVDAKDIPSEPRRLTAWGLLPPRAGVFGGAMADAPPEPWVRHFEWNLKKGKRSAGPEGAGDRAASFVVEAPDEASAIERLTATWEWAGQHAVWEP